MKLSLPLNTKSLVVSTASKGSLEMVTPPRLFPILPIEDGSDLERRFVRLQQCPHDRRRAPVCDFARDRNVPNQPSSEAGPGESPTLSPVAPPSSASSLQRVQHLEWLVNVRPFFGHHSKLPLGLIQSVFERLMPRICAQMVVADVH